MNTGTVNRVASNSAVLLSSHERWAFSVADNAEPTTETPA